MKNRHRFFLRLAGQILNIAFQPLFRIFRRESVKRHSHAHAGMRADLFTGNMDFFIAGLDVKRDDLSGG